MAAIEVVWWSGRLWPLLTPLALVAVILGLRAGNLVDAKSLAQKTAPGRAAISALEGFGRHSFGWRLRVEERQAKLALQRPVTGWGRWDWWRSGDERPWGLPGLVLGMYGLPGWGLLMACLIAPVARFLFVARPPLWQTSAMASATAMAAILTINGLDSILNGAYLMPMLAAAGGLVGLPASPRRPGSSMGHLVVKINR